MNISPDAIVFYRWGAFELNATIAVTWGIMFLMAFISWLATRSLSTGERISRFQNLLEAVVAYSMDQIRDVTGQDPRRYLDLIGSLFLFIVVSNILTIFPYYEPPTGSLSTTAALAICVFFAVPAYGIASKGVRGYFASYARPSIFMLPFNVLGELSRTLALAVRLFGNVMSGTKIVGIFLAVIPFVFPVIMQILGLLTGVIQAYIFAILATVYIGAATRRDPTGQDREAERISTAKGGENRHG